MFNQVKTVHTLKKKEKKQSIKQMVVGRLVFISFSVSFGVFMCLFVYLVSHFCTVTLGSQLISLFVRIKFVISYIKYDSVPVLRSFGEKMKKDERVCIIY